MTYVTKTLREAREIAKSLREMYRNTDWAVTIENPLFPGDNYRVNVG